jgi:hypothetical protein
MLHRKHISCDHYPLLCDVTAHAPVARTKLKHSFPYCCVLDRVYRAVAWQRVDQIRYSIKHLYGLEYFQRNH